MKMRKARSSTTSVSNKKVAPSGYTSCLNPYLEINAHIQFCSVGLLSSSCFAMMTFKSHITNDRDISL